MRRKLSKNNHQTMNGLEPLSPGHEPNGLPITLHRQNRKTMLKLINLGNNGLEPLTFSV